MVEDLDAVPPVSVTLTSTTDSFGETVTLSGSGGVYTATVPTTAVSAASGDGLLSVSHGDAIEVSYSDPSPAGVSAAFATADFTGPVQLPAPRRAPRRTVIYFPGSTLGNFDSREAQALLRQMHTVMGEGGAALIGLDLKKDRAELEAAYNDAAGVTVEFTLNLLARLNRELDGDFDLDAFRHRAIYNEEEGRVEIYLESARSQRVRLGELDLEVAFEGGERIHTENSYKYSVAEIAELDDRSGLRVLKQWFDSQGRFSLRRLTDSNPA